MLLIVLLVSFVNSCPAGMPAGDCNKYCKVSSPDFNSMYNPHRKAEGWWTNTLHVSFPFSADLWKTSYGLTKNFTANNEYDEDLCAFIYWQIWVIRCGFDAICPLLADGVYLAGLLNTSPVDIPDNVNRNCPRRFLQTYNTGVPPGFVDQRHLIVYAQIFNDIEVVLSYNTPSTNLPEYHSRLQVYRPNDPTSADPQGFRMYKAGQVFMLPDGTAWDADVRIVSRAVAGLESFDHDTAEAFRMLKNGTFPSLEWDTGKNASMWYRGPLKREEIAKRDSMLSNDYTENFKVASSVAFM